MQEDLKSLGLIEHEHLALIAKLNWFEKRKELLALVNSISGVSVRGIEELEDKIAQLRKQKPSLDQRVQEINLRHQKDSILAETLEKVVLGLMQSAPVLAQEFIYSSQVNVKDPKTGVVRSVEFYVRAYDDRAKRRSMSDVQKEAAQILKSMGFRSQN